MRIRLGSVLFLLFLAGNVLAQQVGSLRIGIVTDGPHPFSDLARRYIQEEITSLLDGEYEVEFPARMQVTCDWSANGVRKAIMTQMVDPECDIVIASGPVASYIGATLEMYPKLLIAPFVFNPNLPAIPYSEGTSGKENLTYMTVPGLWQEDLQVFHGITPFTKLAVLAPETMTEEIPQCGENFRAVALQHGIELTAIPVGSDPNSVLEQIGPDIEAVYIGSLLPLDDEDTRWLIQKLIERDLPTFSLLGWFDVQRGVLAGRTTDEFLVQRARRVALDIMRVMNGEKAEDLPVITSSSSKLVINKTTMRKLGVSPAWDIIAAAEMIVTEKESIERKLSLADAMREAVEVNPDLLAERLAVESGKQDVRLAWSNWLPSVDLSATGAFIDEDRAEASMGQAAERTFSGEGQVNQLLFSEPAMANVSIQKKLQAQREYHLKQVKLDIALDAAEAYLTLLQTKAMERISRENLRVSRENLELARVREAIGSASASEVYRWEAEIASNTIDAINANSRRNLAEMQLNRVLRRPTEEAFETLEKDINDTMLIEANSRVLKYFDDPLSFKLLRSYLVEAGLANSPEIAQLDQAIAAQKRQLRSTKFSHFAPTVGVMLSVENVFDRSGAGTGSSASGESFGSIMYGLNEVRVVNGLTPVMMSSFPEADDVNMTIGINVSLPLFEGGAKFARRQQASVEVSKLEMQRRSLADKLEQNIRSTLHTVGASYASIRLSRQAAEAADKSYAVVSDYYAQGMVGIIELLDAQNMALQADLAAANALYQFLLDFMNMQRALGQFEIFEEPDDIDAAYNDMDAFIENTKASLGVH